MANITYSDILAAFPPPAPLSDFGAMAAAMSVNRTRLQSTLIGYGTILDVLGPADGANVLNMLETLATTNAPVKWAMKLLSTGQLDIGKVSTRGQIDGLAAAGVFTVAQATLIKNLAVLPDPVSVADVTAAMEGH